MNIIYVIIDRIKSDSPRFFVVLRWISGLLAVAGGVATWLISKGVWSPEYEEAIKDLASKASLFAAGMWGSSLFAKKDPIVLMDGPGGTDPGKGKDQPPKP